MGYCKSLPLILFLLVFVLLTNSASPRVLQDEKPDSDEGGTAPSTVSEPRKSDIPRELGKSSFAVQNPGPKKHPESPTPANPAWAVDNLSKPAAADKNDPHTSPPNTVPLLPSEMEAKEQEGSPVKESAPPPRPDVTEGKPAAAPSDAGQGKGGSGAEETGGKGEEGPTDKLQGAVKDICGAGSEVCVFGEAFACLHISQNASTGLFVIVQNKGQDNISVDVKPTTNINVDVEKLKVTKGGSKRVKIISSDLNGGNITLHVGKKDCVLHIGQAGFDWQQQLQQFAAYATRLNPIYGVYGFAFTVVLVGAVWACCKFARRGNAGVPYQQLEMGAQAPSSAVADNTTSTVDGWEDGWDDDWDDEAAVARPSDKRPTGSVSTNGLSSRSRNNSKDGWDVDWDD